MLSFVQQKFIFAIFISSTPTAIFKSNYIYIYPSLWKFFLTSQVITLHEHRST